VAKQIARDCAERYFLYAHALAPFSAVYDVVGFAGCMTMIHDRPDLLHRILERKLAEVTERTNGYAGAGAHGVWIIETFAGADLISPRQYADLAFPYVQALVKHIKALGLATILYFCGDALPRLDMVRNLGVDGVALEESKKTFRIDVEEIVQRIGDIACVFGNSDAIGVLLRGRPAEIEREVQRQIAAGKSARGYIAGIGCPLPRETNPRNVDALVRAVRKHGGLSHAAVFC
jgi:uroporphyrinogen-III decarboxylase